MLKNQPHLTPEEEFLWSCACYWRDPAAPSETGALDWAKVVEIAVANRMQALLRQVLENWGLLGQLPADSHNKLEEGVKELSDAAARFVPSLHEYLCKAAQRQVETAVLKGLSISINFYHNSTIRPGTDVDLLVRKRGVRDSLAILEDMGFGRWWADLMDDSYYERHHLHQLRCSRDCRIWFEVHWALDHPYTLLTIDTDAIMDRAMPSRLLGAPVRELSLPDLILSLAVHLVKHAVYLPSVVRRPDLARIILADGMLINYLDVAEVIKQRNEEIDWAFVIKLARQWGAVSLVGAVLRICQELLEAPVPDLVLEALPVEPPGGLAYRMMNKMVNYQISRYLGKGTNRLWSFLLLTQSAFVLRPIRLLDLATYLWPDPDFLRRRYGSSSFGIAVRHFLRAMVEYGRLAVDTFYYSWRRFRRVRALGTRGCIGGEGGI